MWKGFVMKRATVTLPQELLDRLVDVTAAKNKTQAVTEAVKEEIKRRKWLRIKAMAGKLEFTASADDLRHRDRRLG